MPRLMRESPDRLRFGQLAISPTPALWTHSSDHFMRLAPIPGPPPSKSARRPRQLPVAVKHAGLYLRELKMVKQLLAGDIQVSIKWISQRPHSDVADRDIDWSVLPSRVNEDGLMTAQMLRVGDNLFDVCCLWLLSNFVFRVEHCDWMLVSASDHKVSYEFEMTVKRQMHLPLTTHWAREIPHEPHGNEPLEQLRHLNYECLKFRRARLVGRDGPRKHEIAQPVQSLVVRVQPIVCPIYAVTR